MAWPRVVGQIVRRELGVGEHPALGFALLVILATQRGHADQHEIPATVHVDQRVAHALAAKASVDRRLCIFDAHRIRVTAAGTVGNEVIGYRRLLALTMCSNEKMCVT